MQYEEPTQNDSFELPEEWIAEAGLKLHSRHHVRFAPLLSDKLLHVALP